MELILVFILVGYWTIFPFILAMLGFMHLHRSQVVGIMILLVAVPSIFVVVNLWIQSDLIGHGSFRILSYSLIVAQFVVMALRGRQTMREPVPVFETLLVWITWAILVPTPFIFLSLSHMSFTIGV